ncbi:hypothetical protein HDU91_002976, partial [Kappamyces sp. JEL0680]
FDGTIKLWDIRKSNAQLFSMSHPKVNGLLFSPDGHMIISSSKEKETLKTWDAYSGAPLDVVYPTYFMNRRNSTIKPVMDSQGYLFHPSDDGTICIYSPKGKLVRELKGHISNCFAVGIDRERSRLFSASERDGVLLWDVPDCSSTKDSKPEAALGTMDNPLPILGEEYDLFGENWD